MRSVTVRHAHPPLRCARVRVLSAKRIRISNFTDTQYDFDPVARARARARAGARISCIARRAKLNVRNLCFASRRGNHIPNAGFTGQTQTGDFVGKAYTGVAAENDAT